MYTLLLILIVLALIWSAFSYYFERSIERPKYSIPEQKNGYEIREYYSYITAQTEVTGTYDEASRQGFRILANYIFGNNLKRANLGMANSSLKDRHLFPQTMAMTAPVTVEKKASEVMAMTAPVIQTSTTDNKIRVISFVMPSKYTLETLPVPNNPKVKIVSVPAKKMAVLKFSWYATAARVEAKKKQLLLYLKRDGLVNVSELEVARYNAPFNAPWMNRNEILVEII